MMYRMLGMSLGVLLALAPVAMGQVPGGPSYGGILRIGMTQEILNLDPHVATAFSSFRIMENVYETLLEFDENMGLKPGLAASWSISPDGTVYTFTIRQGVVFHDGSPLTAEDVKYTYQRVLDPATASPQASYLASVREIEVTSPYQLRITLKYPTASFLTYLALISIVPSDFVSKVADPKTTPLGTGPFRLAEFGPDFVRLVRNPGYWRTDGRGNRLPYLDGLLFRVIPDPATLRAAIVTGEVDLILGFGVDATAVQLLRPTPGLKILAVSQLAYSLLGINNARPPFDDARVRQALSLAIDRLAIVDLVYFGAAKVGGPLPPSLVDWAPLPPEDLPNYTPDLARAKHLLEEAGYPDGFRLKIMPIPTVPEALQVALVIQEQLRPLGIAVEIEIVDFATFLSRWRNSDFDTFVSLNAGSVDPDIHLYRHVHSTGTTNVFKYNDPATDRLLEAGQLIANPQARRDVYAALQRRLAEQVPFLFIAYADLYAVVKDTVTGFVLLPNSSTVFLRQTSFAR
ncbi:MAG: ABC transporter substrate-binding protein [Candidatus Acetothermia bacterium]|jgi:peptide/nickel transport system substrate-binding protein|nr:ABC transporter substrate-binding protein [Candidatus Acetothermia bacterium]